MVTGRVVTVPGRQRAARAGQGGSVGRSVGRDRTGGRAGRSEQNGRAGQAGRNGQAGRDNAPRRVRTGVSADTGGPTVPPRGRGGQAVPQPGGSAVPRPGRTGGRTRRRVAPPPPASGRAGAVAVRTPGPAGTGSPTGQPVGRAARTCVPQRAPLPRPTAGRTDSGTRPPAGRSRPTDRRRARRTRPDRYRARPAARPHARPGRPAAPAVADVTGRPPQRRTPHGGQARRAKRPRGPAVPQARRAPAARRPREPSAAAPAGALDLELLEARAVALPDPRPGPPVQVRGRFAGYQRAQGRPAARRQPVQRELPLLQRQHR